MLTAACTFAFTAEVVEIDPAIGNDPLKLPTTEEVALIAPCSAYPPESPALADDEELTDPAIAYAPDIVLDVADIEEMLPDALCVILTVPETVDTVDIDPDNGKLAEGTTVI